jgi:hypothetical protein
MQCSTFALGACEGQYAAPGRMMTPDASSFCMRVRQGARESLTLVDNSAIDTVASTSHSRKMRRS